MKMIETKLNTLMLRTALVALVSLGAACSNKADNSVAGRADEHAGESADHDVHKDEADSRSVRMDEAALLAAGIALQTLEPAPLDEALRAPGEVVDNAYGTTLITPRVEALVIERHARVGDEVEAGARLVTLSSVEVANAQAELRIAEAEWQRVSALGREAVSGRRINDAKVALDRARAAASAYGLPGKGSGRSNGEFTLTAPHAGRLTEGDFLVGQRIEPGTTLFRLVDESIVWVDATLPSGTASRINAGSTASVVAGDLRLHGTVMRSAHRTSESTRSSAIRVEVPNADDRLHAGDYVDVYLDAAPKKSSQPSSAPRLAVPSAAIVRLDGEAVVFRRDPQGALHAVPIQPGEVIGDHTVIVAGVQAGDSIVIAGAFSVKSRMLKSELGEGHAH